MALIQIVSPEEATGRVKEVYDKILKIAPVVPKPLQLVSSSPELLSMMFQSISYFLSNESFSPQLLAYIRLLVAHRFNYRYCVDFNTGVVQMLTDVTDEQLEQIKKNPKTIMLEENEKALLLFVLRVVDEPEKVTPEDLSNLRRLGWTDQEIVEATNYGADMIRHGTLFKAFKMDEE